MGLRVYLSCMGGNVETGDFLKPIIADLGMELVTMSEWPEHDVPWKRETWLQELSKADIVVCPQRKTQPSKSANRATQAMALGLPVVASPLAAYRKAIHHGVTGFICDTPEEWRHAIGLLGEDAALRRGIGQAARLSVEKYYSIDVIGAQWKAVIERLAAENCNPPKVDIVIPTWNNQKYLETCVESIRNCTDWPHNIIVISSGTDGTAQWLKRQPDIIHYISDRRLHFSEANNKGLELGGEKFVMFLNDDTIVGQGWLGALMHEAMKPGMGAVGPFSNCDRGWMHDEKIVVSGRELVAGMSIEDVSKIIPDIRAYRHDKVVHERKWIAFYATLIPRPVIDKVGRLDEGYKSGDEDLDYCKRITDAGYRIVQTFDSWIFHFGGKTRKHAERADHVLHHMEDQENHSYFEKKWGMSPGSPEFRNSLSKSRPPIVSADIPARSAEAQSPLFVMYTGKAWEHWTPKSLDEGGIGGSETATIYTARDFVKKGWRSVVLGDPGPGEAVYDGVVYMDHRRFGDYVGKNRIDLFVSSRRVDIFGVPINAGRTACLAHDIWLSPDKNAELHVDRVDKFFVLSPWHKRFFMDHHKSVPEAKIHVTRDGVDLSRFSGKPPRIAGRLIYSSSPDRGLETLLDCLPRIRERVPHAEVHVFYGFSNWKKFSAMQGNQAALAKISALEARLREPGVVFRDRLGQKALAHEMLQAHVCLFPTWFTETFFITGVELMAAGVPIVTSDLAAIQSTVGEAGILIPGDPYSKAYRERFIEESIKMLTDETHWGKQSRMGLERAKRFSWDGIAVEWMQAMGIASSGKTGPRRCVFAFNVDHTLTVSEGPVELSSLKELRESGHIVGLCGNWKVVIEKVPHWPDLVSFMGPHGTPKEPFLESIKSSIKADDYILVGHVNGVGRASDDQGAAARSGWRFIQEKEFARGAR